MAACVCVSGLFAMRQYNCSFMDYCVTVCFTIVSDSIGCNCSVIAVRFSCCCTLATALFVTVQVTLPLLLCECGCR